MRIWIEQDACQNSGLCEESFPKLFKIGPDFVANLRDGERVVGGASPTDPMAVPDGMEDDAEVAARDCPAQCIHIVD